MLKNVTGTETDTFDEVNKVFNKLIDHLNSVEVANTIYNDEVEEYNESIGFKKGDT